MADVDARWTAIAYENMKLNCCLTLSNLLKKRHCLKMWRHYLRSHKAKVYMDDVSLKYFKTQAQVSAKSLQWHDSLAFMKVDLIHKLDCGNVVPDALSRQEEFQAMRTIQTLWLMSTGEGNL